MQFANHPVVPCKTMGRFTFTSKSELHKDNSSIENSPNLLPGVYIKELIPYNKHHIDFVLV